MDMTKSVQNVLFNYALDQRDITLAYILLMGIELHNRDYSLPLSPENWHEEIEEEFDALVNTFPWTDSLAHRRSIINFNDLYASTRDLHTFHRERPVYDYLYFATVATKFRHEALTVHTRIEVISAMIDRYRIIRDGGLRGYIQTGATMTWNKLHLHLHTPHGFRNSITLHFVRDVSNSIIRGDYPSPYSNVESHGYTLAFERHFSRIEPLFPSQPQVQQEADVPINPLKKAREELDRKNRNGGVTSGTAQFSIIKHNGNIKTMGSMCHAAVREYNDIKYIVNGVTHPSQLICDDCHIPRIEDAYYDFYDYIINRSPYSSVIMNKTVGSLDKSGLTVRASGQSHLVQGALVMSRYSREWTFNMVGFKDLVDNGVSEAVAFCLSYLFGFGQHRRDLHGAIDDSEMECGGWSDHHALSPRKLSLSSLRRFIERTENPSPSFRYKNERTDKICSHYSNPGRGNTSLYNTYVTGLERSGERRDGWDGSVTPYSTYVDVLNCLTDAGRRIDRDLGAQALQEAA